MPEISLSALTLFDYAVILVLIISAILSTLRGMTREFLGLDRLVYLYFYCPPNSLIYGKLAI